MHKPRWRRASDVVDGSLYEANIGGVLWLKVSHRTGVSGWHWYVQGWIPVSLAEGGGTTRAAAQETALIAAQRILRQAIDALAALKEQG